MTPPQETETHDVTLSRTERWVVHHALTARADDFLDDAETPPDWLLESFETIESGSETFTRVQLRRLVDLLLAYAADGTTPEGDTTTARAVVDRFEVELERP